jgi:hypothetical protein
MKPPPRPLGRHGGFAAPLWAADPPPRPLASPNARLGDYPLDVARGNLGNRLAMKPPPRSLGVTVDLLPH